MKGFIDIDEWKITEHEFSQDRYMSGESIFSIGNGVMGGRASFEENYSGKSLQGCYIGGVYYPDKTRVGWWKNGYPEYFAKILNSAFWIGIDVKIDGQQLDFTTSEVLSYHRELDMYNGILRRIAVLRIQNGCEIEIEAERFYSIANERMGVQSYKIRSINRDVELEVKGYVEADVKNHDSNYGEKFWDFVESTDSSVTMKTKKTDFSVCWFQIFSCNNVIVKSHTQKCRVEAKTALYMRAGEQVEFNKYVAIYSSRNYDENLLYDLAKKECLESYHIGYGLLKDYHTKAWNKRWESCDIEIGGDLLSQQGIRYCIFMLLQTYSGTDATLNIGPKGFTGEKYGGVTYWDTEAYCVPFYMLTLGDKVARNLLIYRYNQLEKAIENAEKLGFKNGAALYPMVTINGEECHNEWEITFEEIHRNGAIAYAIYDYVKVSGDKHYIIEYGLEVLIAISRFWAQRATFSDDKNKYVILGVTGPNEYENNVNNNWYTNYIARWCMTYTDNMILWAKTNYPEEWLNIAEKSNFNLLAECSKWRDICDNIFMPYNDKLKVFLQQEGYMDKEQITVDKLPLSERPLNQKWSWDRILRSCFIKQADVLQGIYFFYDDFDIDTIERNFDFYESRTVHESSLSPSVHSVLASRLGKAEKALELYLRTSRLDLDDYNKEVDEGLHITSMAGSWLSMIKGFAGMSIVNGDIEFKPNIPKNWTYLRFKMNYRGEVFSVDINPDNEVKMLLHN